MGLFIYDHHYYSKFGETCDGLNSRHEFTRLGRQTNTIQITTGENKDIEIEANLVVFLMLGCFGTRSIQCRKYLSRQRPGVWIRCPTCLNNIPAVTFFRSNVLWLFGGGHPTRNIVDEAASKIVLPVCVDLLIKDKLLKDVVSIL